MYNGDIVYGDCQALPCDELRDAWSTLITDSDFRAAAARLPMEGILDDHDYGMNDCTVNNPFKGFAKNLFLNHFGVAPTDPRWNRPGLYHSKIFGPVGARVQLITLDTRWFRSEFKPTDCPYCPGKERYLPYNSSDPEAATATMLGEVQWAWLQNQLLEPAEVRLIVSTVQVLAVGHGYERWGNIPNELSRLFQMLRDTAASGVVLLTGDRHAGGIYRWPGGGSRNSPPYTLYEVTSSSLTHSYRPRNAHYEDERDPQRIGPMFHFNNFGNTWPRYAQLQIHVIPKALTM